eukprot:4144912-Pleurochrysis_carterae.AAC.1
MRDPKAMANAYWHAHASKAIDRMRCTHQTHQTQNIGNDHVELQVSKSRTRASATEEFDDEVDSHYCDDDICRLRGRPSADLR